MKQPFLRPAALAALIGLAACSTSQTAGSTASVVPSSQTRHVQDTLGGIPRMSMDVSLYDAPLPKSGDAHVYLAVAGVDVVAGGVAQPLVSYDSPRTIDLLTLKHTALVLSGTPPAGSYDTIRLLVDTTQSNVTIDGRVYPMIFAQHGRTQPSIVALDAPVDVSGAPGQAVPVDVDFNVLESISLRGNYAYARPKLVVARSAARVIGRVVNAAGEPVENATVVAYRQGTVANTTVTEPDGSFALHALQPGQYHIAVLNSHLTGGGDLLVARGATSLVGATTDITVAPADVLDLGALSD
jgi:Carboxypeptidase regulatory-like domain/Domain of unknown function (DUF4382)